MLHLWRSVACLQGFVKLVSFTCFTSPLTTLSSVLWTSISVYVWRGWWGPKDHACSFGSQRAHIVSLPPTGGHLWAHYWPNEYVYLEINRIQHMIWRNFMKISMITVSRRPLYTKNNTFCIFPEKHPFMHIIRLSYSSNMHLPFSCLVLPSLDCILIIMCDYNTIYYNTIT